MTNFVVFDATPSTVAVASGTTDLVLIGGGTPGPQGAPGWGLPTFVHGGVLVTLVGRGVIYNDTGRALTLGILRASVEMPCMGTSIIVDVKIDGVSINMPLILSWGVYTATLTANVTWPEGSTLSIDVPQVGSDYPGSSLTVQVSAR